MVLNPAPGVEVGDTLEAVMLSPCVGGLVRTWTGNGDSRLWGVADPSSLASRMGRGFIARTLREERRYREVALLNERTATLLLQPRRPTAAPDGTLQSTVPSLQLTEPIAPTSSPWMDLKELLGQAVRYTVETDGLLVVELGGWDAPLEPYCLFLVTHDQGEVSLIETAPAPSGAKLWQEHIQPGAVGATMAAPASAKTIDVVPMLIIDACATWGVEPWDLALTYGTRS
ncbi:MAG TPA: hypothetical protein VGK16_07370 [Candidatus Limnocylindrales bacterium]